MCLRGCENKNENESEACMRVCGVQCAEQPAQAANASLPLALRCVAHALLLYKQQAAAAAAAAMCSSIRAWAATSVCFCFVLRCCHAMFGHALYAIHIMKHRYLLATVALYCTRCAVASSWQVQRQGEGEGMSSMQLKQVCCLRSDTCDSKTKAALENLPHYLKVIIYTNISVVIVIVVCIV